MAWLDIQDIYSYIRSHTYICTTCLSVVVVCESQSWEKVSFRHRLAMAIAS